MKKIFDVNKKLFAYRLVKMVTMNLITDIIYSIIDPRIKLD